MIDTWVHLQPCFSVAVSSHRSWRIPPVPPTHNKMGAGASAMPMMPLAPGMEGAPDGTQKEPWTTQKQKLEFTIETKPTMNEDVYILLKPADFPAIAMLIFVCGYGLDFVGGESSLGFQDSQPG